MELTPWNGPWPRVIDYKGQLMLLGGLLKLLDPIIVQDPGERNIRISWMIWRQVAGIKPSLYPIW